MTGGPGGPGAPLGDLGDLGDLKERQILGELHHDSPALRAVPGARGPDELPVEGASGKPVWVKCQRKRMGKWRDIPRVLENDRKSHGKMHKCWKFW